MNIEDELRRDMAILKKQMNAMVLLQRFQLIQPDRVFEFVCQDKSIKMYLPHGPNDHVQRAILSTGSFYELENLEKISQYINPASVVIDAGSNIGNHAVYFAAVCNAARVICFEPQNVVFPILEKNIELNQLANVTAHKAALGSHESSISLSSHKFFNLGATSFDTSQEGNYKLRTIDGLQLDKLDFIKVDVEGAQHSVLQGAVETIKRFRPQIFVELHSARNEYEETASFLNSLDYNCEQLDKNDYLFTTY